jgi:Flp pilus assembly protein TadB
MARNEIKLRRRLIDDSTLERHRDYSLLLKRHQRANRIKKTKQFLIYTLLIAVVVTLLLLLVSYMLVRMERNRELKERGIKSSSLLVPANSKNNLDSCDFLNDPGLLV